MKNIYDDQEFWVGRVAQAKREGWPWASIFSEDEYEIKLNRLTTISQYYSLRDSKILDAGCAYGWLSEYVKNYTGVDQTVALLEYGKEIYPNANLVLGQLQNLPFQDDQFDVVVCSCVKERIVECEKLDLIEKGRWEKIESEFLRVAKSAIIWPSYKFDYEIITRKS
jgi:SAM-dependent methyltransferase